MEAVLLKLSQRLNLRIEEVKRILSQILQKETYQEDLLEFIGFENIEDVEEICKHKDYFEEKIQEKKFYTEYNFPEFTSRVVKDEECVDTSILGDDKKYFNYTKFNLVQSKVFESAFNSNENILVCAPTGAGKTDIALLTIIKALKRPNSKVVYIVPMKALASEITFKYKNTLKTKSILEFTGDTEPSSYHLSKSDIIICTPEKFDAYTRKLSNIFQNYLSLIIIDEIHILQDERGPVIESIISRIFRYIELRQQTIRIVGLSATLPNYQDVGNFIRASKVFNFDQTYRPVSLKTSIIGLHKKASKQIKEEIFRDKIEELRSQNKQVIVFVNSRQNTVYTAKLIVDESVSILMKNQMKLTDSLDYLVRHKIGIHHAGLPRETRHFMEEKFKKGDLDVLVSTSTLAWGVNLPAHAVVIRGTTYYDQESGKFKDMGILDIFQIFGRAGRPQYKITGEACLITENEKVGMYLNMIKNNIVIESKLLKHIADILNAEIYLNSVISISTGLTWFKSTFMYTRLLNNPSLYGISHDEKYKEDEVLADYILLSINRLQECLLINIDKTNSLERNTWKFESTEFGRISSFYYIHHSTIRNWLKQLDFVFDEESILKMLLETKDFSNIILRGDEEFSLNEVCEYLRVQFEKTELHKLYVLLMAYISNFQVSKFSLKCDTVYIVKNIERVLSAFIDVLLYIRKYELLRICLFIMKKIKKQNKSKIIKYQVKISTDNKLTVESETFCDFWCLCYTKDNIVYVRRCRNRLEMFSEFEIDEVEIIQEQSPDVFKCKPLIYIEEKLCYDLEALDITFNIVYFFSYQEFQRKFVYSFDFKNSEDVFVICRTKNDVKLIKQEFKTRIGLLNITEGKNSKKHIVNDTNSVTKEFICVTTIKEMLNTQKPGLVIFLTCRNQYGDYLSISDILKVCQGRKSLLYEEETFVKYMKEKILIK